MTGSRGVDNYECCPWTGCSAALRDATGRTVGAPARNQIAMRVSKTMHPKEDVAMKG